MYELLLQFSNHGTMMSNIAITSVFHSVKPRLSESRCIVKKDTDADRALAIMNIEQKKRGISLLNEMRRNF